jgi:hypothetical protein
MVFNVQKLITDDHVDESVNEKVLTESRNRKDHCKHVLFKLFSVFSYDNLLYTS